MLSACGISQYWSSACDDAQGKDGNRVALTGDLKQQPSDFVVVEVDPTMQYTSKEDYTFYAPQLEKEKEKQLPASAVAALEDGEGQETVVVEEVEEEEAPSSTLTDTTAVLSRKEDILPFFLSHKRAILAQLGTVEEVMAKCETLAQPAPTKESVNSTAALLGHLAKGGFADTAAAPANVPEADGTQRSWWEAEYVLGRVRLHKTEKKLLHYLVALTFPHLRSRVRPCPGASSERRRHDTAPLQEFFVVVSPQFIFFHYLFDSQVPTNTAAQRAEKKVSLTLARWQQWDQYLQLHGAFSSPGGDGCEAVLEAIDTALFNHNNAPPKQERDSNAKESSTEVATFPLSSSTATTAAKTTKTVEGRPNGPAVAHHTFNDAALEDAIAAFLPASNAREHPRREAPPSPPQEETLHANSGDGDKDDDEQGMDHEAMLFSPGNTKNGETLYTAFTSHPNDSSAADLSDKALRRHFHDLLRRCYPYVRCQVRHQVVSLQLCHAKGDSRPQKRGRDEATAGPDRVPRAAAPAHGQLGKGRGEDKQYVYYIVQKVNLDTAEMRQLLGHHFDAPEGQVCVAGMKDKRAMTWQRCSLPLPTRETATALPICLRWPNDPQASYLVLQKGSLTDGVVYPSPIQLGQLRGNAFDITVRHVRRELARREGAEEETLRCTTQVLTEAVTRRFQWVTTHGFINYFGQQRFSESIASLQDHTGLLLLQGRYVAAVKSLYRSCPALYEEQFPEKMDPRHVPANARDAQAITQALKLTQRLYFQDAKLHQNKRSKPENHKDGTEEEDTTVLTREDIWRESPRWQQICERAITTGVPYALRSMWIHAAQSLYFNVMASYVATQLQGALQLEEGWEAEVQQLQLPLGGYQMELQPPTSTPTTTKTASQLRTLVEEANTHALQTLGLTAAALYGQKRVAGVPLSGGWRHFLVRPTHTHLSCVATAASSRAEEEEVVDAELRFFLPSSSYATVLLREVFGNNTWW